MQYTLRLLLLYTLLLPLCNRAQDGGDNALDDKYAPGGTFSGKKSKSVEDGASVNYLKVNAELLARNVAAVFYEHVYPNKVSVQGGIGYSYYKDMISATLSDLTGGTSISDAKSSLSQDEIIASSTFKQGFNPFLGASLKCGIDWSLFNRSHIDASDWEPYIEFCTRYEMQHYELKSLSGYSVPQTLAVSPTKITMRNMYLATLYGSQLRGISKWSHELYGGVCFRFSNFDTFTAKNTVNQYYSITSVSHSRSGSRGTTITPMFLVGYIVGFQL